MAEYSLYKSLELPSSTEHYNIGIFNKNTTVIDSELHKLDLINESLSNHTTDELNPHKVKKSQIGLSNVDNTSDINKPVSTVQQNAIDEALYQSNYYTDTKIAELINGAPETLDTLKEVADAIEEDKSIVDALDSAIGTKANQNELNTHINNAVIHVTQSDKNNINIAKEHADSQHARVDATKVEKSDTNGNIKINGVETNVYTPSSSTELPLTTSLDATEEGVAALDSTVGKVLKDEIDELNNNLAQHPQYIYDSSGKITGYKTQAGADTVFPFSRNTLPETLTYELSPPEVSTTPNTSLKLPNVGYNSLSIRTLSTFFPATRVYDMSDGSYWGTEMSFVSGENGREYNISNCNSIRITVASRGAALSIVFFNPKT
ncbi:MAG: hypothetical protein K2H31_00725 [Lachnospiraceae bacterium]|nr:hypothetical protein [Lachnospiraceae bacterium]